MANKYIYKIMEKDNSSKDSVGFMPSIDDVTKSIGLDRHAYQIKRTAKKLVIPVSLIGISLLGYKIYKSF